MERKRKEELNITGINEIVSLSKRILNLLYIVMIIAIVFISTILIKELGILTFLMGLLKVLSPLFIGFVIAWLFNPIVKKLEEKGLSRVWGALLIYAIFIFILILFLRFLVPTIYNQINELFSNLPTILNDIKNSINHFFDRFASRGDLDMNAVKNNVMATLENHVTHFTTTFPAAFLNFMVKFFSSMAVIVMGLFVGLYMLFDFDSINKHFMNLIPTRNKFEVQVLLNNIGGEVRKTVNGTLLVALMVFVCDSIGFAIVGLQAPLLFGLFCGMTDLIPYIGPYIGGALAVIIGFSQNTFIGIMTLMICVIVQCIENFILQPIVMSKTMKLHPVTIIIGLLIFGNFFGIIGMIFATPCIALIKVIFAFVENKYNITEKISQ